MVRECAARARSDGAGPGPRPCAVGRASGRARGQGPCPWALARGFPAISTPQYGTAAIGGSWRPARGCVAADSCSGRTSVARSSTRSGRIRGMLPASPPTRVDLAGKCRGGGTRRASSCGASTCRGGRPRGRVRRDPRAQPPRPAPARRPSAPPIRPAAQPRGLAPRAALSPGRTPGGRVPGIASRPPRPVWHGPSRRGGACRGSAGVATPARLTS